MPSYHYDLDDGDRVALSPFRPVTCHGNPWPAPTASPGHFRDLTAADLRRLEHLQGLLAQATDGLRSVLPTDLRDDDPEDALIEAADSLDDAIARVRSALDRLYAEEAA